MTARPVVALRVRASVAALALVFALAACVPPGDDASAAPSGDAAVSPTAPEDTDTGEASDDRFCEITQEGIALSAQAMAETQAAFTSLAEAAAAGDAGLAGLADIGNTIEDMGTRSKVLYAEAVTYVEDPAVVEAFNELGRFIDLYSLPVADLMQSATSFEQLGGDLAALVADPEVTAMLESAAGFQATTEAYTEARCGIDL
jgi:hypothetical protein